MSGQGEPFIECPNRMPDDGPHNAMVVVTAVMKDGSEKPRRAICATCRHDWDPSTECCRIATDDFAQSGGLGPVTCPTCGEQWVVTDDDE